MRNVLLVPLLASLELAACQSLPQEPARALNCDNGDRIEVGYSGEVAVLTYKNQTHRLQLTQSRTSARYEGDGLTWQTDGFAKGVITPVDRNEGGPPPLPVTCRAGPPRS